MKPGQKKLKPMPVQYGPCNGYSWDFKFAFSDELPTGKVKARKADYERTRARKAGPKGRAVAL